MKDLLTKLKLRLPAILLLAVTLLFWGQYDRYEPVGPVLIESPPISDAFKAVGEVSETNSVFRLHVPASGKHAEARFRLEGGTDYAYLRASGRIRTEDVVRGKNSWNSARLIIIQRKADGRWVSGYHQLHSEYGTIGWTLQMDEIEVIPAAVSAELVIQQIGTSGTAWFDSIQVVPVKLRPAYPWLRIGFVILWISAAALYYRRTRLDHRKLRFLILINVMAILYGTLLPGALISRTTEQAKDVFIDAVNKKQSTAHEWSGKKVKPSKPVQYEQTQFGRLEHLVGGVHRIGHFILFASLCFLVYCSAAMERQRRAYYFKVAFDLLLFSAVTESLQYLTMDRSPGLIDWLMDIYGMITALFLFLMVRFACSVRKRTAKA